MEKHAAFVFYILDGIERRAFIEWEVPSKFSFEN